MLRKRNCQGSTEELLKKLDGKLRKTIAGVRTSVTKVTSQESKHGAGDVEEHVTLFDKYIVDGEPWIFVERADHALVGAVQAALSEGRL